MDNNMLLFLGLAVIYGTYSTTVAPSPDVTTTADLLTLDKGLLSTLDPFAQIDNILDELRWNEWTPWTDCTEICETGQQLRIKICSHEEDSNCTMMLETQEGDQVGYRIHLRSCNTQPCPIDGVWGPWTNWTDCSVTCGMGTTERERQCIGPLYGGEECEGSIFSHEFCENEPCPVEKNEKPMIPEETFTQSDERPSAISIGAIGCSFVAVVLGALICLDTATLGLHCAFAKRNVRAWRNRGVANTASEDEEKSGRSTKKEPERVPLQESR